MRRSAQTTQGKWMWYLFTTHIHIHTHTLYSKVNTHAHSVVITMRGTSVCRHTSIHGTARASIIFYIRDLILLQSGKSDSGVSRTAFYIFHQKHLCFLATAVLYITITCHVHKSSWPKSILCQFNAVNIPMFHPLNILFCVTDRLSSLFHSGLCLNFCMRFSYMLCMLQGSLIYPLV